MTLKRARNFTLAVIRHAVAGLPTCTQEQIDKRLEVCRACPLFLRDPFTPEIGLCTHNDCGCKIHNQPAYLSKLAWSDQSCPLEKWPRLDVAAARDASAH